MRSSSRCFHGHNLHPRVMVLCMVSAISFFPSDNFFYNSFRLKRITWALLLLYVIKNISHHAHLKENELLFCCQSLLVGNFLRFACARAHLRALMTQKSCAVGMRNAILRNYLNARAGLLVGHRKKSHSAELSEKICRKKWLILLENSGKFSGQISLQNDQQKWLILCEFSGHISLESNQFCTALTDFLKWYHDKNHIFPVEAMLKYKQVFCMSKKMLVIIFKYPFSFQRYSSF